MKTTVKTTHSGKVTASQIGPQLVALEFSCPLSFQGMENVYLTIDAAYVLAEGIKRLAEQMEAQKVAV